MKVCMGGTFHPFHAGHEALLKEAIRDAEELFVGVTDGKLAERDRDIPPWQERAQMIEIFCASYGYEGVLRTNPLTDAAGPSATGDYDVIVVSEETAHVGGDINATRAANGLRPLEVRVVPFVIAQDRLPVSATRVASGDIDRDGRRLTPVRVAIGSANPVKVSAVESSLAQILHAQIHEQATKTPSGVPEQPKGDETLQGARNRARSAMESWPDADYAVGVEAGLQPSGDDWYDMQACVVIDRLGRETSGWGPGFQYPDWVTKRALDGEMISSVLGPVANDPRIGGTTGAIGFLTENRMDRTELTRIAVLMAMVPRLRPDLYRD